MPNFADFGPFLAANSPSCVSPGPNFGEGIDRAAHFSGLPKATDTSSHTEGVWDDSYVSQGEENSSLKPVDTDKRSLKIFKVGTFMMRRLDLSAPRLHVEDMKPWKK